MTDAGLEGRRSGYTLAFGKQLDVKLKCSAIKTFSNT